MDKTKETTNLEGGMDDMVVLASSTYDLSFANRGGRETGIDMVYSPHGRLVCARRRRHILTRTI